MVIYYPNEVTPENLTLGEVREYSPGSYSTGLFYKDMEMTIQTNRLFCPYGSGEKFGNTTVAFVPDPELLRLIKAMDAHLEKLGDKGDKYCPLLQPRKDRGPLVRVKYPVKFEQILPRSRVRFLLQLMPMWFNKGKYGTTFKVIMYDHEPLKFRS